MCYNWSDHKIRDITFILSNGTPRTACLPFCFSFPGSVITGGQAHPVEQQAVQDLGIGGNTAVGGGGEQGFGDAVEGELFRLGAVEVVGMGPPSCM